MRPQYRLIPLILCVDLNQRFRKVNFPLLPNDATPWPYPLQVISLIDSLYGPDEDPNLLAKHDLSSCEQGMPTVMNEVTLEFVDQGVLTLGHQEVQVDALG